MCVWCVHAAIILMQRHYGVIHFDAANGSVTGLSHVVENRLVWGWSFRLTKGLPIHTLQAALGPESTHDH